MEFEDFFGGVTEHLGESSVRLDYCRVLVEDDYSIQRLFDKDTAPDGFIRQGLLGAFTFGNIGGCREHAAVTTDVNDICRTQPGAYLAGFYTEVKFLVPYLTVMYHQVTELFFLLRISPEAYLIIFTK